MKHASQGIVKTLSDGGVHKIEAVGGFDLNHDVCVLRITGSSSILGFSLILVASTIA